MTDSFLKDIFLEFGEPDIEAQFIKPVGEPDENLYKKFAILVGKLGEWKALPESELLVASLTQAIEVNGDSISLEGEDIAYLYRNFIDLLQTLEIIRFLPVLSTDELTHINSFIKFYLESDKSTPISRFIMEKSNPAFTLICFKLVKFQEFCELFQVSEIFSTETLLTPNTLPHFLKVYIKNVQKGYEGLNLLPNSEFLAEHINKYKLEFALQHFTTDIEQLTSCLVFLGLGKKVIVNTLSKEFETDEIIKSYKEVKTFFGSKEMRLGMENYLIRLLQIQNVFAISGILNYQGIQKEELSDIFEISIHSANLYLTQFRNATNLKLTYSRNMLLSRYALPREGTEQFIKNYILDNFTRYKIELLRLFCEGNFGFIGFYKNICEVHELSKLETSESDDDSEVTSGLKANIRKLKSKLGIDGTEWPYWVEFTDEALSQYLTMDDLQILLQISNNVPQNKVKLNGRTIPRSTVQQLLRVYSRISYSQERNNSHKYIQHLINLKKHREFDSNTDIYEQ